MLEPPSIPKCIVQIKAENGYRFWSLDRDGKVVHNHRNAARFDTPDEARQFVTVLRRTKPDAFFKISSV
jgi:hypothetical protein